MSSEQRASQAPEPGENAAERADSPDNRELRAALDQARARERLLEQRLSRLEGELAAIYGSRTWRLTAPARKVLGRAARLRARLRAGSAAPPPGRGRDLASAKQALLAEAEAALAAFLAGPDRLALPNAASPRVSILLVLFNQAALTLACLRAIAAEAGVPAEVVIVDNASSDRTGGLLGRIDGARIVRNAENRHFLHAVNQAAGLARGEALLLLNNDACLRSGALQAAWTTLCARDAGAVGGPIVLPDGTLQEAGSIIFSDGTCLGYGRGADPGAAEFQFVREVDYCSAAFLLIRRADFAALGGLDPAFAPAYYEETDLCMRLRAAGRRVLYEPRAAIDHYEFASATSSAQALDLQRQHHTLFVERNGAALAANHLPPGTPPLSARMRGDCRGRVLVIEDRVPFPSFGAGYPRSARLLHELVVQGWFVTLYPLLFPKGEWPEIRAAFPDTMEVALGHGEAGLSRFLAERADYYDAIVVSRPHNMRSLLDAVGANPPRARLIYDAEAIFAAREADRLALAGAAVSPERKQRLLEAEMRLARAAQTVVTVSERDAEQFRKSGCADVQVLGHALVPEPSPADFQARADLLFVGALDDDPSPNTDSLLWFASEVMPLLDELIGNTYRVLVAGRCRAERIARLASPRIRLLGRVDDLAPLYASARLFIAPTRYAAGIPHKIHEAAARGVPVVATPLLAGQLGWQDGREVLIGDTPPAFAAACARAYSEPELWRHLRDKALERVAADCDPDKFARQVGSLMASGANASAAFGPAPRRAPAPLASPGMPGSRFGRLVRHGLAAARYLRRNGWRATSQRLDTELRRRFGRLDYATWIRLYDTLRAADLQAIHADISKWPERPVFSVLLTESNAPGPALRLTLDSVLAQIYPDWEIWIARACDDPESGGDILAEYAARDRRIKPFRAAAGVTRAGCGNAILAQAAGQLIVPISAGDRLRPHSLYMLASERREDPACGLIYADHDIADAAGRREPNFKPDWSRELALGPDLTGGLLAVPRDAAIAAGGYREGCGSFADHDLVLRASAGVEPGAVRHVRRILSHHPGARSAPSDLLREVVAHHLQRIGEPGEVSVANGVVRVAWALPDPPPASLIVPTRDNARLLRGCLSGLLGGTDYPALEILVIDNDSLDPAARRVLREAAADPRVRVLPYSQPFNYAAMNNLAVAQARGEVIALLNNDIAIREPGWLREMVSHALRAGVGAVGAKLYYGDGTIQHAGVVTGMTGIAGHPFRGADGNFAGPHGTLMRVRTVSAVTAACMVLRRAVYEELGGLDETNLAVSYNDVDLCLRLRARGYRVVWTPFAQLDHLESASRGSDADPVNIARAEREYDYMRRKWGPALDEDPFYSPNLTLAAEDCVLAFPPRIGWPWRE